MFVIKKAKTNISVYPSRNKDKFLLRDFFYFNIILNKFFFKQKHFKLHSLSLTTIKENVIIGIELCKLSANNRTNTTVPVKKTKLELINIKADD